MSNVPRAVRFTRRLGRWLLASQYASIEVEGAARVPAEGPAILVANHGNGLVDSLAILAAVERPAAPLAKAPLFKSRILRPWLKSVGAVPVYREQDVDENAGRGVRANLATFAACRERLQAGGAIVLFPEGGSQPQPRLLPLRTGVARIALDAARPLHVVPIGLVYEAPRAQRGRLLVTVGEPIPVDGSALAPADRRGAIATLTRQIEAALHELLAEADSQSDLEAMRLLAVARAQEHGVRGDGTLAEAHRATQLLARGLTRLKVLDPAAIDALRARVDAFQRSLEGTGVPLALLETAYSSSRVLRFLVLTLLPSLILIPLYVACDLLTAPGRALGDVLSLRAGGASEDVRVFARGGGWAVGNFALGLLTAVVLVVLGFPLWVLAAPVLLLVLLSIWVWRRDRFTCVREGVRAWLLLAGHSKVRADLRAQRHALIEELELAARRLAEGVPPV